MLSFYRDKIERTDINVCILGQSTTEGGSLSVRTVRSQNSLLTASGTGSRIEMPVPQTETAPAV